MTDREATAAEIAALRARISALRAASLRISASLDLETVLNEVVESARALTGARFAANATIDEAGAPRRSCSRQRNTVPGVLRCQGRLHVVGERQQDQSRNQRNDQKNHEGDFQVVPQHSFSRGHAAAAPNARPHG